MAINFPNDPATTPGDGGQWTDPDGNLWQVEIISGEAVWTMIQAAGTDDGGGVDSVNNQTGDVSLGIQDMNDFTLATAGGPYWATECGGCSIPGPGEWAIQGTHIRIDSVDSNGIDYQAALQALDVGSDIWFSSDGTSWTKSTVDYYTDFGGSNPTLFAIGIDGLADPGAYWPTAAYLSPTDPSSLSIPLAEGDILQWNASTSTFNPGQIPDASGPLDGLLSVDGDAVKYDTAPTLGTDATDVVVPTMGQVRAAIASNGGTSVALNDLSDVSYNSGDLIVTGLTDISFEGDGKISDGNSNELTFTSTGLTSTGNFDSPLVSTNEVQIKNGSNYISLKAPTLGADVAFNLPGTDGAASSVLTTDGAGNLTFAPLPEVTIPTTTYEINYESTTSYKFTGPGLDGTELNPTLYVIRGQKYIFSNTLGAHPFQLQTVAGTGESPYTDGVTGDQPIDLGSFEWEVQMDAPSTLYYQCTVHAAMAGSIKVLDNSGAGGAGAVDSVNSQTGVVSLGIQDMNDFALVPEPLGLVHTYNTVSDNQGTYGSTYNSPGEVAIDGTKIYMNPVDSDGNEVLKDECYRAIAENGGSTSGITIWLEFNLSGTWNQYTGSVDPSSSYQNIGAIVFTYVLNLPGSSADTVRVAFFEPAEITFVPLAEGDILQWADDVQKFQPAALASVATSGDYNDLINAPSAGDAPVTSVNTEVGDVSLGIQDMDDFSLNPSGGPTYTFDDSKSVTPASGTLTNFNASFLMLNVVDKNGVDWQTSFYDTALFDENALVEVKVNGVSIGQKTVTNISNKSGGRISFIAGPAAWYSDLVAGDEIQFLIGTFPVTPAELAAGDFISWNGAEFRPTQLDYSEVNNTPAPATRKTVDITATLDAGATTTGEVTGTGATGFLLSCQTDVASWIRIYTDSASMTADAARTKDTDPAPGSGVLFEALYTTTSEKPITPGTSYFNLAGDDKLFYRLTNESAVNGASITVTLKLLPME